MIFSATKNTLLSTALLSTIAMPHYSTGAMTGSSIQPIIQQQYDRINAAFIRKDIQAATANFTADYISINTKGEKQNLAEFRQQYTDLFNRIKLDITTNKTTIKKIALVSQGVDVSIEQHTEAKVLGNKVVIRQTSRNFWLKTPQGWRLQQSKILTNQTTFNGKTFKG
jgi:hypothetical protein